MENRSSLSSREKEVIGLLAKEMYENEIAAYLQVDVAFVKVTISNLMRRTSTMSLVGLVKEAVKQGWIA